MESVTEILLIKSDHDNPSFVNKNKRLDSSWGVPYCTTPLYNRTYNLGLVDLQEGKQYFVAAETGCNYFEEIVFPDQVTAGLKIKHLGNSSVQYDIGLFKNQNQKTSARGHFVHILVDKNNRRPVDIPTEIRKELKEYL